MKRVLVFTGTLGQNTNKNKIYIIKFEDPTLISALSIIPNGRICHVSSNTRSKTFPSVFELSAYACDLNRPYLSFYPKIGLIKQNMQFTIQQNFFTKILLLKGTFDFLSFNLYEDAHSLIENIRFDSIDFEENLENIPNNLQPTSNDRESKIPIENETVRLNEIGELETDSDSLMIGDFDIDQVLIHDFSITEESLLSQVTQINPHQLLLTGVYNIKDPSFTKSDFCEEYTDKNILSTFITMIEVISTKIHEKRWLFTLEEIAQILSPCLRELKKQKNTKFEEIVKILYDKCVWGFNKDVWKNLPAFLNFRLLKTTFRIFNILMESSKVRRIIDINSTIMLIYSLANDLKEYMSMSRYLLDSILKLSMTTEGANAICNYVSESNDIKTPLFITLFDIFGCKNEMKINVSLVKIHTICKLFLNFQKINTLITSSIKLNNWEQTFENELQKQLDTLFVDIEIFLTSILGYSNTVKPSSEWAKYLRRDKKIISTFFYFMKNLKFIECMVFLITKAGFSQPTQALLSIKTIILTLCSFNKGQYFLANHPEAINNLSTLLISDIKNDTHYFVEPLNYTLSSRETIETCSWVDFGLYLIFSLQVVQVYDFMMGFNKDIISAADLLRCMHQLLCFMSCDVGLTTVVEFFTRGHTILQLLPLIKKSNLLNGKDSINYTLTAYAVFIFKKILQNFEHTEFLTKNINELSQFISNESCSYICEIIDWLMPIQRIYFNQNALSILSNFIIKALDEFEYNIHAVRACSTALRVIIAIHLKCSLKFKNFEFDPDLVVVMLECGVFEMMMKFNSKFNQILKNKGCLRNQYHYTFSIYRCLIAFLSLNRIFLLSMTNQQVFPYDRKYIEDLVSLNSHIRYFRDLPISNDVEEFSVLILEFFTTLLQLSYKKNALKYIISYIFNNENNIKENISLLLQIFLLIRSNTDGGLELNFNSHEFKKFYQIFNICYNSSDCDLFQKFLCLYYIINLFSGGYLFIFRITIDFLNSQSSTVSRFNSLMALSAITNTNQFKKDFFDIFNGDNNYGIVILNFIEEVSTISKNYDRINRGIMNFISQIICIHMQFSEQTVQIAFFEEYFIKNLIRLFLKFCDSQVGFETLCQFMGIDYLLNLYIAILGTNSIYCEKFIKSLYDQKNSEYISLRVLILHKLTNNSITSDDNIKICDILSKLQDFSKKYIFDIKILNDQKNEGFQLETVMNETSKFIELNCCFFIDITYKRIELSKLIEKSDPNFNMVEELKVYFRLSPEISKKTRIRRFYPLTKYKQLSIKDGEFKVNSNFRDSKFREFVELFKTKKNVTSRLPSLHVDDYSAIQLNHSKHSNINLITTPIIPPSSLFPLLPKFNPGIKLMPFMLQKMLAGNNNITKL